jgi:hypothetical protein
MKKMNDFENILDECLQRLLAGESIESCLSRYPQHASGLEPLLRTAQDTLKAADIKARPEFRDLARRRFQAAVREAPRREKRDFFAILRPSLATVAIIAIILLAGGGVVGAAGNSLPGSPLYSVKLATESVRLALTPSDLGKAELNAAFADERIDEIIRLAENGDAALIEETANRMNEQLIAVANLAGIAKSDFEEDSISTAFAPSAMAPKPTATPTATPAPTMTATVSRTTPLPTPTPTVVLPTPTIITPPDGGLFGEQGVADGHEVSASEDDDESALRETILRQFYENIQALQEALEQAPPSLKPALEYALAVAEEAYARALDDLFY